MAQSAHHVFTFADYERVENDSPIKHEFFQGRVWAMAGGSPRHAAIAARIIASLTVQLRDRPCEVFTSDLRVRVGATGLGTYPDPSVVRGSLSIDPEDPARHTITNPKVLVEVTSPSTEEVDRGDKREQYQTIPSLDCGMSGAKAFVVPSRTSPTRASLDRAGLVVHELPRTQSLLEHEREATRLGVTTGARRSLGWVERQVIRPV
jgi:hypothetical protein